ncbi:MAG: hypothetical protein ACRD1J_02205 [Terriglobia bacterium]
MRVHLGTLVLAVSCFLALGLISSAATTRTAEYSNRRWGFCIAYPSTWTYYEPFDGSGVELRPITDSDGVISLSALPTQPRDSDPSDLQTPLEGIEAGLQYMSASGEAHDLRVMQKHEERFLGHAAATVTFTYRDRGGVYWLAKEIDFSAPSRVTFHLGLKVPPEETQRFEPVFERVVRSLKLNCRDTK